jgi:hypothetical protein
MANKDEVVCSRNEYIEVIKKFLQQPQLLVVVPPEVKEETKGSEGRRGKGDEVNEKGKGKESKQKEQKKPKGDKKSEKEKNGVTSKVTVMSENNGMNLDSNNDTNINK